MATLTITRGLPGSGKTTFAEKWVKQELNRVRVNRDDLRFLMFGKYAGLNHWEETSLTFLQHGLVACWLGSGVNVIVDDTNLNTLTVKGWQKVALAENAHFRYVDFWMEPERAIEMVARRGREGGRSVPREVIDRMYLKYLMHGFSTIKPLEVS